MPTSELAPLVLAGRLTLAGLIGLAVGIEREWSARTPGASHRFAGIRTFLIFGLVGGIAGLLIDVGAALPAAILLAAGTGFTIAAFVVGSRRSEQSIDGTTEVAAFAVLGLGALAAIGYLALAAGCGAVIVFALGEKERLHWLVSRIGETEMRAALSFLVLALVILPILPAGPFPQFFDAKPRAIWTLVLFLSAINFAGYLARRAVGPGRGYGVTGALAGLISSTALTAQFSRVSRAEPQHTRGLALGIVAACTVLPVRMLVISVALNPAVSLLLIPYVTPPFVVGLGFTFFLLRNSTSVEAPVEEPHNPLRFGSALQMALLFVVAFVAISYARESWGSSGMVASSLIFGLADLDALTVSMNRLALANDAATIAAQGIGIGLLANTLVKLTIAVVLGESTFRRLTFAALATTAVSIVTAIWWQW